MITDMDPPHGERRAYIKMVGTKGLLTLINPIAPQYGAEIIIDLHGVETRETFTRRPTFAFQLDGVAEAILSGKPVLTEGDDIIGNAAIMTEIRKLG